MAAPKKETLHKVLIICQTVVNAQIEQLGLAYAILKGDLQVDAVSSIYLANPSKANQAQGQLTAAFVVLTEMGPAALGKKIDELRRRLPRTAEIILALYEDETMLVPELTLPHPELHTRPEWLIPAAEIWPDFIHPVLGQSLQELTAREDWGLWGQFFAQGASLSEISRRPQ